jgi:hypothetical protein
MRAKQLIEGGAYRPDTLKAMTEDFDSAWAIIADRYTDQIEAGRLAFAEAMLSIACEDSTDARVLISVALQAMAGTRTLPFSAR